MQIRIGQPQVQMKQTCIWNLEYGRPFSCVEFNGSTERWIGLVNLDRTCLIVIKPNGRTASYTGGTTTLWDVRYDVEVTRD